MKIQITQEKFFDQAININNAVIQFKDGVGEIDDEKGKEIIAEHDWIYEEGKVPVIKEKEEMHVYDEAMIDQLRDQNAQLAMSLKAKNHEINMLKMENQEWRELVSKLKKPTDEDDQQEEEVEKKEETTAISTEEIEDPEALRKRLSSQTLAELKNLGSKLNIPGDMVAKKSSKKDWVNAIIEYTFK